MKGEVEKIKQQFEIELLNSMSLSCLNDLKVKYVGKKGLVKELFTQAQSQVNVTNALAEVNGLSRHINIKLQEKQDILKEKILDEKLNSQKIDITYPIRPEPEGREHLISKTINEATRILNAMGFELVSGPEIEDPYYVFDALNTPSYHPARQMLDSFYLENNKMLRTHTSSVQIRTMEKNKPPFYIISIGRVYRNDWDATHTPMFHQIECLCVDKNITMSNMIYCIKKFLSEFFGEVSLRIRPSYFPFTEPSAEVDIKAKNDKWLEILGCGVVHPNVLSNVNINADEYSGFAFGVGVERITMLKYNIDDLRHFFTNDLRY
jgi:phenylalanyl-tRNA synthetase alpha chain